MRALSLLALVIGMAGCIGCPPINTLPGQTEDNAGVNLSPPTIDTAVEDAPMVVTDCQAICANLYNADCAEATRYGQGYCVDTCDRILKTRFVDVDVKCLLKAETTYAVKLCGMRCPHR